MTAAIIIGICREIAAPISNVIRGASGRAQAGCGTAVLQDARYTCEHRLTARASTHGRGDGYDETSDETIIVCDTLPAGVCDRSAGLYRMLNLERHAHYAIISLKCGRRRPPHPQSIIFSLVDFSKRPHKALSYFSSRRYGSLTCHVTPLPRVERRFRPK